MTRILTNSLAAVAAVVMAFTSLTAITTVPAQSPVAVATPLLA